MMAADNLISDLHSTLIHHAQHPYPDTPNPPGVSKRASVALIIRIQPDYHDWPPSPVTSPATESEDDSPSTVARLDAFFAQSWVQKGTPEILFIKRANRVGDKWTGHVAFPGGGRDPEDSSDLAAAIRETDEEVGIKLTRDNAIQVGNLSQQIVTSAWAKKAYVSYVLLVRRALLLLAPATPRSPSTSAADETRLMVLCPYIFLVTNPALPPVRLQPTEVASTHWVSIPALLSPRSRTVEYQDVAALMARGKPIPRWFMRSLVGQMTFSAVRLLPSESVYCTSSPGFLPEAPAAPSTSSDAPSPLAQDSASTTTTRHISRLLSNLLLPHQTPPPPSLILWGLTLGITSDFLDTLPPPTQHALPISTYPRFTAPDMQAFLSLLSHRARRRKEKEMGRDARMVPVDTLVAAMSTGAVESRSVVGIQALQAYFAWIRRAWVAALVGRLLLAGWVVKWVVRRWLVRRGGRGTVGQ